MSWTLNAIEHARRDHPREACGLVVIVGGEQCYWPCRNVAGDDRDFELCPQDYVAAEDAGEIVAVFHSHPHGLAVPSEADYAAQRASGLPWHILGADGAWAVVNAA